MGKDERCEREDKPRKRAKNGKRDRKAKAGKNEAIDCIGGTNMPSSRKHPFTGCVLILFLYRNSNFNMFNMCCFV